MSSLIRQRASRGVAAWDWDGSAYDQPETNDVTPSAFLLRPRFRSLRGLDRCARLNEGIRIRRLISD